MRVLNFKGRSLVSWAIKKITRSDYSHSAFLFDESAEAAAISLVKSGVDLGKLTNISQGSLVEAWSGGVKNPSSWNTLHTPGTPIDVFDFDPVLSPIQEKQLILALVPEIGAPYSYYNVFFYFVLRWPGREDGAWFCSELVTYGARRAGRPLFNRTEDFRVPPDWVPRSLALRFRESVVSR